MRCIAFCVLLWVPATVAAESWCASPLWAHEWGVQAFDANGRVSSAVALPSYFHDAAAAQTPLRTPTRELAPDGGERALPVLHFYSAGTLTSGAIPIGIEVGFTHGEAVAWYPQVDIRRTAAVANGTTAQMASRRLRRVRDQPRTDLRSNANPRTLASDPTAQLVWDRLELTAQPRHAQARSNVAWVRQLRGFDRAMWVNGSSESERFVFYEARTGERVPLVLRRGDTHRRNHRHVVIHNEGAHSVHDVFVVHRQAGRLYVFFAPAIPARASAGFVLEDHRVRNEAAATVDRMRTRLVDSTERTPPTTARWTDCVMMRDPAQPMEHAEGHRLFEHEVEAILAVWGSTFFEADGTTIVYREDGDYLESVMPLGIYTDMFNFVRLRRLGLAVWKNVRLP